MKGPVGEHKELGGSEVDRYVRESSPLVVYLPLKAFFKTMQSLSSGFWI